MNRQKNNSNFSSRKFESKIESNGLWKHFLGLKSLFGFDLFQPSLSYREKLQIIYANIRV
jgi:hypothetical protein